MFKKCLIDYWSIWWMQIDANWWFEECKMICRFVEVPICWPSEWDLLADCNLYIKNLKEVLPIIISNIFVRTIK